MSDRVASSDSLHCGDGARFLDIVTEPQVGEIILATFPMRPGAEVISISEQ